MTLTHIQSSSVNWSLPVTYALTCCVTYTDLHEIELDLESSGYPVDSEIISRSRSFSHQSLDLDLLVDFYKTLRAIIF